ncbi:RagB/SusD family nutrient uptake outer membrane protein [Paraflavitalea sp. CAU 1676]|uniref:RagB/SusD family nutrient uptake outer membrane protein n=1 Tax=Paraflavitalea sp. CAU 1676 TaxID=3032598 RepID=UPI0023DCBDD2|nr:RagB/SusD family nutrient uptake outer membrane protein [Paraflavitalea sp. CAU 1676]MDF2191517.1 RagB/SusD family nutrient uptake outer membrane protein [Paraflavitalea sp. CAU 1676]
MKKILQLSIYLLAGLTAGLFTSCKKTEDFLRLPNRDGLDARIWETEGAVQYFLNETYHVIMPEFYYQYTLNSYAFHMGSDENLYSAADGSIKKLFNFNGVMIANDVKYVGAKYQGTNPGDNRYFDIARCNIAIANLPVSQTIPAATKRSMLGQFYVLRAMAYLGLTKVYGGMPLVLEPQSPGDLKLSGRVKAKVMFEQIVKDLDSGMVMLDGVTWLDATERGKLTKAAAAAIKAKALLYWASPQFNPVNDGKHRYDATRWEAAHKATKEAYEICKNAGHALVADYSKIFLTEGTANKEAIIVRSYSDKVVKRTHGVEARCRPASEQGQPNDMYYASTRMIDAYTMKDGTPINQSAAYDPEMFWLNRDPRFDATIAYNGAPWKLSGVAGRRQWTYVKALNETGDRGFYCKRFSSPDLPAGSVRQANDLGGSGMDWIELRFAEVMLDYAETANETGDMATAKTLVREIRQRAGIQAGANDYGLGFATSKDQLRDLILNERMVEFAFEGKRHDDLRRTRRMHLLTGNLLSMQFECIDDNKRKFLETLNAAGKLNRDTLDMTNKASVKAFFKAPRLITVSGNGGFAMPEFYYFFGLSNQFINSSPLLEQTIGWDGGTFDPL